MIFIAPANIHLRIVFTCTYIDGEWKIVSSGVRGPRHGTTHHVIVFATNKWKQNSYRVISLKMLQVMLWRYYLNKNIKCECQIGGSSDSNIIIIYSYRWIECDVVDSGTGKQYTILTMMCNSLHIYSKRLGSWSWFFLLFGCNRRRGRCR